MSPSFIFERPYFARFSQSKFKIWAARRGAEIFFKKGISFPLPKSIFQQTKSQFRDISLRVSYSPYDPWDWYIYPAISHKNQRNSCRKIHPVRLKSPGCAKRTKVNHWEGELPWILGGIFKAAPVCLIRWFACGPFWVFRCVWFLCDFYWEKMAGLDKA